VGLKGLCASHFKKIWKASHGSREKITPPSCINKQRLQQRFDREILPLYLLPETVSLTFQRS